MNFAASASEAFRLMGASLVAYTKLYNSAIRCHTPYKLSSNCHERTAIDQFTQCLEDNVHVAERQMVEMKKTLRKILSLRNSFVKINTLPDELLCKIFRMAGEGQVATGTPLAIKHTCVRWRSVAEGVPLIWTELHLPDALVHTADAVSHFVALSQHAPLSLTLTSHLLLSAPPLRSENVVNRLEKLELSLSWGSLKSIHPVWPVTVVAPSLRSLILHANARDSECDIVPPLFQRSPHLEILRMEGCRFPWAEGMYSPGLKELSISSGRREGYSHAQAYTYLPRDEGFIVVLQTCKQLQILRLDRLYCLRSLTSEGLADLPNLRRLSLQLPAGSTMYVLDNILAPPKTRLWLSYHTVGSGGEPDVSSFLGQLRSVAFFRTHLLGRFDSRDILDESDAHVHVQYCDMRWNRERLPKGMLAAIVRNQLHRVENLVLDDVAQDSQDWSAKLLLACPHVRKLQLVGWRRPAMWNEIVKGADIHGYSALRELTIVDCEIGGEEFRDFTKLWTPFKNLTTLTMEKCSVNGDDHNADAYSRFPPDVTRTP